ncbi:MAG: hypothetical protein RXR20_26250, partial [Paraburkholderia sp.]
GLSLCSMKRCGVQGGWRLRVPVGGRMRAVRRVCVPGRRMHARQPAGRAAGTSKKAAEAASWVGEPYAACCLVRL